MIISWNTTNECNLFCSHCYRDSGVKAHSELNTSEAKKLIDEIARANFKIMIFSGGEPLMRSDIFELTKYATEKNLRAVLGTNGTLLTEEVVKKLKSSGVMRVGISLDSLSIEKHNELRGANDAWQRTIDGIENCYKLQLPFQIHTTVMNWNADEIEKLTDFAVSSGAVAHHIFFLVPTGRGEKIESDALDKQSYENLLTRIMKKSLDVDIEIKPTCAPQFMRISEQLGIKGRYGKGCIAGTAYCIISPNGKVQPCAYMDKEVGNVREQPFDEIWQTNEIFAELRTANYQGQCGYCQYKNKCGGCRARAAYYHDGDIMAEDILCMEVS